MNRFKKVTVFIASVLISLSLCSTTAFAADYTVVKNDTLNRISTLFSTQVSTLKSSNQLTSNVIHPGQVLEVPAKVHTVKRSETLFKITKKYGISLYSLRKANNKWNNRLKIGQKIIIPGIKQSNITSTPNTVAKTTTAPKTKTVIPYTQAEVDLLARLITAETTGEPYEAMVAVGGVVVNRVQNPDWPSTITTVINHVAGGYYQFTPVKNGYINNPPSDIAVKAAWDALYGSDPSNGACFYFDDSSTNQWLWSKPLTARIGSMVFVN